MDNNSLGGFFIIFTGAVILGFYFLPSIVAMIRGKRNAAAIFVMNLFLGWTFIDWVVALVWAVAKDNTAFEK